MKQQLRQEDILPCAETYEQEMKYFPWGRLIDRVLTFVVQNVPQGARVIDLMCGPGFLLGQISEKRPDLHLAGVDINKEFINYAQNTYKKQHPRLDLSVCDVLCLPPSVEPWDIVICTAGLHHLPYEKQPVLLDVIDGLMKENSTAIIAESCLPEFWDEESRKLKAVEFGSSYIREAIAQKAPEDVLMAAIDIMRNDIMGLEFKRSIRDLADIMNPIFHVVSVEQVWPLCLGYECGDFYFILEKEFEQEEEK